MTLHMKISQTLLDEGALKMAKIYAGPCVLLNKMSPGAGRSLLPENWDTMPRQEKVELAWRICRAVEESWDE